jgi:hypothetical protein
LAITVVGLYLQAEPLKEFGFIYYFVGASNKIKGFKV